VEGVFSEVLFFEVVKLGSGRNYLEGPGLGLLTEGSQFADHLWGAGVGTHLPNVLEAPPRTERVEQLRIFHAADERAGSCWVRQSQEEVS
jgi:hypothetical protein